jgi:hypothetical protein
MENGASAEISVVGKEGIIGIALFMGAKAHRAAPSSKAVVMPTAYWGKNSKKNLIATPKC